MKIGNIEKTKRKLTIFDKERPVGIQLYGKEVEPMVEAAKIAEASKFGGLFSLLWHNSRLTEYEYPGVQEFYKELLGQIVEKNPPVFTGEELIKLKMKNCSNSDF